MYIAPFELSLCNRSIVNKKYKVYSCDISLCVTIVVA